MLKELEDSTFSLRLSRAGVVLSPQTVEASATNVESWPALMRFRVKVLMECLRCGVSIWRG